VPPWLFSHSVPIDVIGGVVSDGSLLFRDPRLERCVQAGRFGIVG